MRADAGVHPRGSLMLRIHFLNVGHGDCTIIEHPSGRLSMIDINNSQEYDSSTLSEIVAERRQQRALASALGTPFRGAQLGGAAASLGLLGDYNLMEEAKKAAREEITDPVAFMQRNYSGRRLWRFILTHPDLDH